MKKFDSNFAQGGLSLLEMMVAVAGIGTLVAGLMVLTDSQFRFQQKDVARADASLFFTQMQLYLNNNQDCTNMLNSADLSQPLPISLLPLNTPMGSLPAGGRLFNNPHLQLQVAEIRGVQSVGGGDLRLVDFSLVVVQDQQPRRFTFPVLVTTTTATTVISACAHGLGLSGGGASTSAPPTTANCDFGSPSQLLPPSPQCLSQRLAVKDPPSPMPPNTGLEVAGQLQLQGGAAELVIEVDNPLDSANHPLRYLEGGAERRVCLVEEGAQAGAPEDGHGCPGGFAFTGQRFTEDRGCNTPALGPSALRLIVNNNTVISDPVGDICNLQATCPADKFVTDWSYRFDSNNSAGETAQSSTTHPPNSLTVNPFKLRPYDPQCVTNPTSSAGGSCTTLTGTYGSFNTITNSFNFPDFLNQDFIGESPITLTVTENSIALRVNQCSRFTRSRDTLQLGDRVILELRAHCCYLF